MNVISLVFGLIGFVIMCVGLFPLLGWLNWIALVFCILGIATGAASKHRAGLAVSSAVLVVSALRLFVGGGFI